MSLQGAGPFIPSYPSPVYPVSPIELFQVLMQRDLEPSLVPGGVFVGGAPNDVQQLGCIALMDSGNTQIMPHVPLQFTRIQARCMAHTVSAVNLIAQHAKQLFEARTRELVTQPSTGNVYLVQRIVLIAGPTGHWDSPATWEELMFFEVTVGTQPVS